MNITYVYKLNINFIIRIELLKREVLIVKSIEGLYIYIYIFKKLF